MILEKKICRNYLIYIVLLSVPVNLLLAFIIVLLFITIILLKKIHYFKFDGSDESKAKNNLGPVIAVKCCVYIHLNNFLDQIIPNAIPVKVIKII